MMIKNNKKSKKSNLLKKKAKLIKQFRSDIVVNKAIRHEEIENKIIAVDFDGVIVTNKFPRIGKPDLILINKLKSLYEKNTLILWTCRNGKYLSKAVKFCESLGLKFHYVNENSDEILKKYNNVDSRKITADYYIDDKNLDIDCIFDLHELLVHRMKYKNG